MTVANDPAALASFLEAAKAGFSVETARLSDADSWNYVDGALSHASGGFFNVVGLEFPGSERARVWLYQPQSALTGLLSATRQGERHFLLQARAEPGTHGGAQYGPTVQSTPANYLRRHNGRATPYVERLALHCSEAVPYADSFQLDLGERYFMKSKRLVLADCSPDLEALPSFIWAPASVVQESLLEPSCLNIDLRSFFAVMPWSQAAGIAPRDPDIRASTASEPRPGVLGRLATALRGPGPRARYVDLDRLDNWEFTDRGLFEIERRHGFSIEYYEVTAPDREVPAWVQPLLNSSGPGRAALCCRRGGPARFEVLVRIAREPGLMTGAALLPTVLRYPGAQANGHREEALDGLASTTLARTTECDEGGRFYRDVSTYELLEIEGGLDGDGDSAWISVAELKHLLASSNVCSIQLRGLASLLPGIG